MKILKVRIKNLNSLRIDKIIDFTASPLGDTGIFAIVGDTGAGKTTILDAITLSLYGRVHRNESSREVPREVMTYGTSECLAESEFEVFHNTNKAIYRAKWSLHRARGKADGAFQTPRYELSKRNEKGEFDIIAEYRKEWQRQIEEITGLNYAQFCRSMLLAQGDFAAFLRAGEQERSDLLEQITGTAYYTEISKASFQRWKIEQQKLDRLYSKRDALQLLAEEKIEELNSTLVEKNTATQTAKMNLDRCATQLAQVQKKKQLQTRQVELQTQLQRANAEIESAQSDFLRLQQHLVAAPLQADLRQLDELAAQQTALQSQSQAAQEKIETLQQQNSNQQGSQQELETNWKGLQKENSTQQKNFRQVSIWDAQIGEQKKQVTQLELSIKTVEERQLTSKTNLEEQRKDASKVEEELQMINTWLKQHQNYTTLEKDLPKLELNIPRILLLDGQIKEGQTSQKTLEETIITKIKDLKKITQRLERAQTLIVEKQADFQKQASDKYDDRTLYLEHLQTQYEELAAQLTRLLKLKEQVEHKAELAKQGKAANIKIESLEAQVTTATQRLTEAKEHKTFKQVSYEQQQLILSYEERRADLKEGEECPLCLSTEHPFRTQEWQADFVNKAKLELETAEAALEAQQDYQQKLLQELSEQKGRKDQLTEAWKATNKQIESLKVAAEAAAQTSKKIALDKLSNLIKKEETSTETQLKNLKTLKEIHLHIVAQEETERAIESEYKVLKTKIEGLETQYEIQKKQVAQAEQELEERLEKSAALLEKYDCPPALQLLEKHYSDLSGIGIEFVANTKRANEQNQRIQALKQTIEHTQNQITERAATLEEVRKKEAKQRGGLAQLEKQRSDLFGTKNPEIESQVWQKRLLESEQALQEIRAQNIKLQEQIAIEQTSLREKQSQLQANKKLGKTKQGALLKSVVAVGFASLNMLKNALLPLAEQEQISQQKSRLEQQQLKLKHSLTALEADLTTLPVLENEHLEELTKDLQEQEEYYQSLQQMIGAIREQLQSNEQQKMQSKKLLDQIDKQKREHSRWELLKNLIGMESGKKFRVFAQGLTLQQLVHLANKHLLDLNDRYFIQKRIGEELTLEIIDRYQADNLRSMNTLSGGESFLVSLALALGLSDLAGQNTQIHSLFIDEGFGTLDESTLDLAITTLENLQASGKTIGIISHVKTLQERISTQIKVDKKGSGFSTLEIITI